MNTQRDLSTPPAPRELPRRNRYRDTTTAIILAEAEVWLWDLAELDADLAADPACWDHPEQTRAFVLAAVEDAHAELARRERLRHHPKAPDWPTSWRDLRLDAGQIKAALPLERYITLATGAVLERRGKELWCCCPLPGHEERTPSFAVNEAKGVFYCFGCHRSGDLFTFAAHLHGTARFDELLPILAEAAGLSTGGGRRG